MTAAAADRYAPRMGEHVDPIVNEYPETDNVIVYTGTMVGLDSAGRARPMTVSATTPRCVGVCEKTTDNTGAGHAAGKYNVPVRAGTFRMLNDGTSAVAQSHVGGPCYAKDDQTVSSDSDSSNRAIAGTVMRVDSAGVWVKFDPLYNGITDAALRVDLASTANAAGASLVGVEDAAGLTTAATVEAALAELYKFHPLNLADPGTGQAIPVTRSAYVGFTIGSAGAETNTLAIPTFHGQRLILNADTVGTGTRAVTCAQAINQAGNTVMTFASARDCIVLSAIKVGGAFRWQVSSNDGVALS